MRRVLVLMLLILSGCTITSQDSDKVGMKCLYGHDEFVERIPDATFVCDKWVPSPEVTP